MNIHSKLRISTAKVLQIFILVVYNISINTIEERV